MLNQLNYRSIVSLTVVGILLSFNGTLFLFSFTGTCCLLFKEVIGWQRHLPWHRHLLKGHLKILNNNQYNRRFDSCNYRIDVCTTVESTLVRPSNRRLYDRRFDGCTIVESTHIRLLHNCRFNGCATAGLILDFKLDIHAILNLDTFHI